MNKLISSWIEGIGCSDAPKLIDAIRAASEVMVFGSRGAGVASHNSDIDILCVGSGERLHTKTMDLLWIDRARSESDDWLGSELASHVATHGVVIKGTAAWVKEARVSNSAIELKLKFIGRAIRALMSSGQRLKAPYYEKHLTAIRRDVVRLKFLVGGIAVPATPIVDGHLVTIANDLTEIRDRLFIEYGARLEA